MSGFAGTLGERVTLLTRGARDDLGGAQAWSEGVTLWAAVRPDGAGSGDDAGAVARWAVTLRTIVPGVMAERLRWRGRTMRVRRIERDPAFPERLVLRTEEVR